MACFSTTKRWDVKTEQELLLGRGYHHHKQKREKGSKAKNR
jgi:hypothetical protein